MEAVPDGEGHAVMGMTFSGCIGHRLWNQHKWQREAVCLKRPHAGQWLNHLKAT